MKTVSGLRAAFLSLLITVPAAAETTIDLEASLAAIEAQMTVDDDLQLLFVRGMLLSEMGRPLEAADMFRQMLVRDPRLLRPRLELARVLVEARDYDGARYHFEQVLANPLPEMVRFNVLSMLARIRNELPSYTITLELVSDSNPKQATSDEVVEIGGLLFQLNDDARAKSALGLRLLFEGRVPLPGNPLWFVHTVAEHLAYEDKEMDFSYLHLAGGRHIPMNGHTLTLELGHHWARYAQQSLFDGVTWTVSDYRNLRPDLSLQLQLSGQQFVYPLYSYKDGWQYRLAGKIVYAASPVSRWEGQAGFLRYEAKDAIASYDEPFLSARYVREWTGGWITGLGTTVKKVKYDGADPFFGLVRDEKEFKVEADLTNRRLRFWRLSPRLQIGYAERTSNIDFYSWDRTYVRLGMTAEF